MAMSESSLSGKIQANIIAALGAPADPAQLAIMANAIAKAVVDEVQQNAVVTVTGVQSGGSTANGTVS